MNNTLSLNTHLAWPNTPYANLSQVEVAADYLGIHSFRDDNTTLSILDKVASDGFRLDVISNADVVNTLRLLEAAHPGALRAIEGPNEVGDAANPGAMQQALWNAVSHDAVLKTVPVFNESVAGIADQSKLGNLAAYTDYATAHIYWGSGTPWYATDPNYTWLNWTQSAQISAPGKPIVVTEMGVNTALGAGYAGTSEIGQAKDILNAMMDGAKTGISFMNIYELVNSRNSATDTEGNFGLYDWNWNAKPAATALHNFTSLLMKDTGVAAGGTLDYSISGIPNASQAGGQMLFQDHAGHFDIVTWTETSPAHETVTFAQAHDVNVYDPMAGSSPIASHHGVTSVAVDVVDHPLIIQVSGAGSGASASHGGSGATGETKSPGGGGAPAAGTAGSTQYIGASANDDLTGPDGQTTYIRGEAGDGSSVDGAGFNDVNGNAADDAVVGHSHGCDGGWGHQGGEMITGGAGAEGIVGDRSSDAVTGGGADFHRSEGDHVALEDGAHAPTSQAGADVHLDDGQVVLQTAQLSSLTPGWITG